MPLAAANITGQSGTPGCAERDGPSMPGEPVNSGAWRAGPAPDRLTADMCADLGQGQLTLANGNRTVVLAGLELCTCASATGLGCAPGALLVRGGCTVTHGVVRSWLHTSASV